MFFKVCLVIAISLSTYLASSEAAQASDEKCKIALLFLTRKDLNHPNLWHDLLTDKNDKFSVYFHSKETLEDNIFKNARISKIVPTTWSIHVKAWQRLIQEALKDKSNAYFAFLSESCVPLYPLDYIYQMITADERTHMAYARSWWSEASPREVHEIDAQHRYGNNEWMVLNRKHAALVAKDRAVIRIVAQHHNDQEAYFATLFSIYGCLDEVCNHTYTYVNWTHATNGGASPYHFEKVSSFTKELINQMYHEQGYLFARKFTKDYPEKGLRRMIKKHEKK